MIALVQIELEGWQLVLLWGLLFLLLGFGFWLILWIVFCAGKTHLRTCDSRRYPTPAEDYETLGLGPIDASSDHRHLYLDLMKRAVTNILYEDTPLCRFSPDEEPELMARFDLEQRVEGADAPTLAHTMIGIRRIENLQSCIEKVIENNIPGDLVETGAHLGGATLFMRAVLKAHRITDRRVFACD
ncbi:MAG: TylF/MycF/NovP-related O-methyltransferase, partial [Verrucomicrobiota bacterium]